MKKTKRYYRRNAHGRFSSPNGTLMFLTFIGVIGVLLNVVAFRTSEAWASIPAPMPEVAEALNAPAPKPEAPKVEIIEVDPKPVPQARVEAPKAVQKAITGGGKPTQEQKDATAVACAHAWERHESELIAVNLSREVYMTTCYTDILAIARHESGFNCNAKNETGTERSYGCFQINLDPRLNRPYTREQVSDFVWSVNWTVEHLHAYGYPRLRSHAIQCHNGCGAENGYVEKVKATSARFERERL